LQKVTEQEDHFKIEWKKSTENRRRLAEENAKLVEDRNNVVKLKLKADLARERLRIVHQNKMWRKGEDLGQVPSFEEVQGADGKKERSMEMLDFNEEYKDILAEDDDDEDFEEVGGDNDEGVSDAGSSAPLMPRGFEEKQGIDFFSKYCEPPQGSGDKKSKVENPSPPSPPPPGVVIESGEENNGSGLEMDIGDDANVFDGSELADAGYKIQGRSLLAMKDDESGVPVGIVEKEEVNYPDPTKPHQLNTDEEGYMEEIDEGPVGNWLKAKNQEDKEGSPPILNAKKRRESED